MNLLPKRAYEDRTGREQKKEAGKAYGLGRPRSSPALPRRAGCLALLMAAAEVSGSAVTVTSTRAPFSSFRSSPFSSIKLFSIRRFRYRRSAPSTAICAFSGWLGRGDWMILSTVPGMVTLGGSGIRVVSSFSSAILADLAIRGFAISFLILARVALPGSFLVFLCSMPSRSHRYGGHAVPFCTVAEYAADACR